MRRAMCQWLQLLSCDSYRIYEATTFSGDGFSGVFKKKLVLQAWVPLQESWPQLGSPYEGARRELGEKSQSRRAAREWCRPISLLTVDLPADARSSSVQAGDTSAR